MATSLSPVEIPSNTWVDLYAATGISVGTQITFQNVGSSEVITTESLLEPVSVDGHNTLEARKFFSNTASNIGAWAFSLLGSTLQVESSNTGFSPPTELGSLNIPQNLVVLNNLADLDAFVPESGGFRTFQDDTNYLLAGDITSSDPFICGSRMNLTSNNQQSPILTYSGTGIMFTGVDVSVTFNDIRFDCPNAEAYNFSATSTPNSFLVKMFEVVLLTATKFGTFDDYNVLTLNNASGLDVDDGITFIGNNWIAVDIERMAIISAASATFVGIDLGTSVQETFNINRVIFGGGVGSIGISGLASSANISANSISAISANAFLNITTPLSGITVSDIRYRFTGNEGVADSTIAVGTFLSSPQTVTNPGAGTFVAIDGVNWSTDVAERFTASTAGLLTYIAEFDSIIVALMTATIEKSGGGVDELCARIAVNGTTSAKTESCTENTTPTTVMCMGLFTLSQNDTLQGFVANIDSGVGTDTIVSNANLTVINGF